MKLTARQSDRGVAVIIVLVVVTLLTIFAGLFAYSMKIETRLAFNANNDEQMLWLGRGGVELARYVVALSGGQPYDSLNQIWAGGPGTGPETNGPLMGVTLDHYPIGDNYVSVKIIDLERKININTANDALLRQVLTSQGADAGDISTVADSIQDWIDTDDATRPAGAESDYYQGLTPPYYAKNGPMDDISELLLVKGVTVDMYYGISTNVQNTPFQHHKLGLGHAPSEAPQYNFGLTNVFTPFSSGRVNINTADTNVLSLIPGMDSPSVAAILKFRAGPDGVEGTSDDTPFASVNQAAGAGVNPQAAQQLGTYATTKSTTFEVHVTAHIGDYAREFVAVLFRHGAAVDV
ncbi:MAG TPA: general secretion pathway protein GspK, partial [Phycisphaerae bacterium]